MGSLGWESCRVFEGGDGPTPALDRFTFAPGIRAGHAIVVSQGPLCNVLVRWMLIIF